MSSADAYVESWAAGAGTAVVLDRLLDAGLQAARDGRSPLVDLLDAEGESTRCQSSGICLVSPVGASPGVALDGSTWVQAGAVATRGRATVRACPSSS